SARSWKRSSLTKVRWCSSWAATTGSPPWSSEAFHLRGRPRSAPSSPSLSLLRTPRTARAAWASLQRAPSRRGVSHPRSSGVLLHPTSLPGRFGIGDLGPAARQFVAFLTRARQRIWQVLPLGPTGYGDSPYQCFSAF